MSGIYTGYGDGGSADLIGGERALKCDPRLNALGDADELNSHLGLLEALLPDSCKGLAEDLQEEQRELMSLSGRLAAGLPPLDAEAASAASASSPEGRLERRIDAISEELGNAFAFVLPGGHPAAAQAHVARAVCRRCERTVVALGHSAAGGDSLEALAPAVRYLNRLSDYLFTLACLLNARTDHSERHWRG
jgi:cob(I)alamin adenosyltransferase